MSVPVRDFSYAEILLMAAKVNLRALDEFISACIDESGNPKAPSKKALMEARKYLPSSYKNTLIKATGENDALT